jgi:hypothetical protein
LYRLKLTTPQVPRQNEFFMPALIVILFSLLISLPAAADQSSTQAFLEQVISAQGGADNLQKAKTMVQSGRIFSLRRGDVEGRVERRLSSSDHFRIVISYPGEAAEMRILAGEEAWRDNRLAPAPLADAMRLQAARIALPYLLVTRHADFRDAGREDGQGLDGGALRYLELPLGEDLTLRVGIDETSGLILNTRGRMSMQGQHMDFVTEYSNHWSFDGVVMGASEEQYAMGHPIGRTELDRVSFEDELPATLFRP